MIIFEVLHQYKNVKPISLLYFHSGKEKRIINAKEMNKTIINKIVESIDVTIFKTIVSNLPFFYIFFDLHCFFIKTFAQRTKKECTFAAQSQENVIDYAFKVERFYNRYSHF